MIVHFDDTDESGKENLVVSSRGMEGLLALDVPQDINTDLRRAINPQYIEGLPRAMTSWKCRHVGC